MSEDVDFVWPNECGKCSHEYEIGRKDERRKIVEIIAECQDEWHHTAVQKALKILLEMINK